jgi:hypothetical protein
MELAERNTVSAANDLQSYLDQAKSLNFQQRPSPE